MNRDELTNVFKYIVKKCDMLINNSDYEADAYTQDTVEDIAELCNHILDGDYGKLVEVKDVDLEKELNVWRHNHFQGKRDKDASGEYLERVSQLDLAKHFFELGLLTNNPITAEDRGTAEEIILNLKRVEQDYRIDLTKEIKWVRNKVQKGE